MMNILVIDDEFALRNMVKTMLADTNCSIRTASDAISALIALKDNPIDVIVTDYRLPGLGGKDWLEILKKYHPTAKLIVISGYRVAEEKAAEEGITFLRKPFTRGQLIEAIGPDKILSPAE